MTEVAAIHLRTTPEGEGPQASFQLRDHAHLKQASAPFRVITFFDEHQASITVFFSDQATWERFRNLVVEAPEYPTNVPFRVTDSRGWSRRRR